MEKSIYCGCSILATVHGEDKNQWFFEGGMEMRKGIELFERYIFLKKGEHPGVIEAICNRNGEEVILI